MWPKKGGIPEQHGQSCQATKDAGRQRLKSTKRVSSIITQLGSGGAVLKTKPRGRCLKPLGGCREGALGVGKPLSPSTTIAHTLHV